MPIPCLRRNTTNDNRTHKNPLLFTILSIVAFASGVDRVFDCSNMADDLQKRPIETAANGESVCVYLCLYLCYGNSRQNISFISLATVKFKKFMSNFEAFLMKYCVGFSAV